MCVSTFNLSLHQIGFNLNLGETKLKIKKNRSKEQNNALYNIEMLYKARYTVINFFDEYFSYVVPEAKHEESKGSELKILPVKKMLQRL